MKKFFIFFFVVFLLFSFSFVSFAAVGDDEIANSEDYYTEPSLNNIRYIPAFPDCFYNGSRPYYILFERKSDSRIFLFLTSYPWHNLNYWEHLIGDDVRTNLGPYSMYEFDSSLYPRAFRSSDLYVEYAWGIDLHLFNIIHSNYTIPSAGGGVYYTPSLDFVSVTVALMHLQHYTYKCFDVLVPVSLGIFSLFILVKLIRRILHPKIRKHIKVKNKHLLPKSFIKTRGGHN